MPKTILQNTSVGERQALLKKGFISEVSGSSTTVETPTDRLDLLCEDLLRYQAGSAVPTIRGSVEMEDLNLCSFKFQVCTPHLRAFLRCISKKFNFGFSYLKYTLYDDMISLQTRCIKQNDLQTIHDVMLYCLLTEPQVVRTCRNNLKNRHITFEGEECLFIERTLSLYHKSIPAVQKHLSGSAIDIFEYKQQKSISFETKWWRPDLITNQHMVEQILKIIGFSQIRPSSLSFVGGNDNNSTVHETIRSILLRSGISENMPNKIVSKTVGGLSLQKLKGKSDKFFDSDGIVSSIVTFPENNIRLNPRFSIQHLEDSYIRAITVSRTDTLAGNMLVSYAVQNNLIFNHETTVHHSDVLCCTLRVSVYTIRS